MDGRYFNYTQNIAESRWERGSFLANWWRLYAGDPHWVPPYKPDLRCALEPSRNPHLRRMEPLYIYTTALPRSARLHPDIRSLDWSAELSRGLTYERPVAAALLLHDPRRPDRSASLAILHCANDLEALERLAGYALEQAAEAGFQRLLGPVGLAPHLGSGLLLDHWDRLPPLHAAYNPPYLPDLFEAVFAPLERAQVFELAVPPAPGSPTRQNRMARSGPGRIVSINPARLAQDLLPLFAAAGTAWQSFPPPDPAEAEFILRWLSRWPLYAWLAELDGQPAGFMLLQPDLAAQLRRAGGGRAWWQRLWLNLPATLRVPHGRLLFGGVLPELRRQGLGSQLLETAFAAARQQGWQSLSTGPLLEAAFLQHRGAFARQSYAIYQFT